MFGVISQALNSSRFSMLDQFAYSEVGLFFMNLFALDSLMIETLQVDFNVLSVKFCLETAKVRLMKFPLSLQMNQAGHKVYPMNPHGSS
jgi:hypothetical protein